MTDAVETESKDESTLKPGDRVAVTGGSGGVGQMVVRHLLGAGYEVVNLDRMSPRPRSRDAAGGRGAPDAELPDASAARFVFCDLRDRSTLQPVLETCRAVCHLGEIPNTHQPFPPEEIYATNTASGATVLQTAADLGIARVVYTSSCQVYGVWNGDPTKAVPQFLPMDESHPLRPMNVYALAKVANEGYCRLVAESRGLSVAVFRLPWVLRPGDGGRPPKWLGRTPGDGPFGEGMGTYLHVDDAARAYVAALRHPRPGREVYHLANDDVLTVRPLRDRLAEHHPDYPPLPADWPDAKSPVLTDKARDHFGWRPTHNLREDYLRMKAEAKTE